jgi:indolepyruvate ferredoxin oxidoreductase
LTDPDTAIAYFTAQLTSYQNAAYAARYETIITQFMTRLKSQDSLSSDIGVAAARALYRAMAIKDEYDVARQLTSADFTAKIAAVAGEDAAISYHLAPPMLAWLKARDGSPRKIRFGRWLTPYLRGLARLSWLRDSWADPFGYATDRRAERAYRERVIDWLDALGMAASPDRQDQIKTALELMLKIHGYGHVRMANHSRYAPQITAIIAQILTLPPPIDMAAE